MISEHPSLQPHAAFRNTDTQHFQKQLQSPKELPWGTLSLCDPPNNGSLPCCSQGDGKSTKNQCEIKSKDQWRWATQSKCLLSICKSPFMALASIRKGQTSRWKGKPGSLTLTLISNTASPSKSLKHFISSWAIHKQQHSSSPEEAVRISALLSARHLCQSGLSCATPLAGVCFLLLSLNRMDAVLI